MDGLIVIQLVSMMVTLFIGLMLALSRLHMTTIVGRYELSRWLLVCSMFIYSVHYLLQIVFGFRASGDDVGAVINILFYAPVTYLLSFSIITVSRDNIDRRRYMLFSIISYTTILLTFAIGYYIYRSLHLGPFVYVMGVEFFASILFAVIDILKEGSRIREAIESDTAGDLSMYNNYIFTGTFLLLIVSLIAPAIIFSRVLLLIVGPLFLLSLFIFSVNFVCLGLNLRPIADVLESNHPIGNPAGNAAAEEEVISAADKAAIQAALDSWVSKGGFSNQDVSLGKLAISVGFPAQTVSRYISMNHGVTFRVWLSRIRLEEAKRLLVARPEATIEYIAEECGFASRSYFQNLFKAETGFTPREWRLKMCV